MGRGNWFPGNSLEDCAVVYVDYSDSEADASDSDLSYWRWQDFREYLAECLPKSFKMADDYDRNRFRIDRDSTVIAYNGLFVLWVDTQSDDYHTGIGFTVRENAPGFARSKLADIARLFFDKLAEAYPLSVRNCAWTSSKYIPSNKQEFIS
jgi:hypothetical protein